MDEFTALSRLTRRAPDLRPARWLVRRLRKAYLRKPRPDVRAEVEGSLMELDPRDYVEGQLLFSPQLYEARERAWVAQQLHAGDVFVDLGAHAGCYTLCAARAVGAEGRVVAIEADPRTVERLRRNVQLNAIENVTIVAEGASDADELRNLSMNVSKNSGAGSFLISVGEDTPVRCRPLLDMLLELGVRRVAGLKADIEGFEYRVLQRFLADAPEHLWPGFVVVEQKEWWVDQAGGNTVDLLAAHGYRAAWHTGDRRSWRNYAMLRSAKGSAWES